ncbi:hypothetical protein PR003_g5879 [Phytophthora rubi]|uniref:Uncharacterized protein n=1 Tax=Phytophthora rubi TaxID=129364 RepID=A0A6A3LP64_9STRA|nr:hypothetical protein PR002_g25438 [Phytophthora rubi]KAE9017633.1 hypothetical protein PR001_g14342 [Phytophthora rubi]KAE9349460.1 hypothetical protein PR003_g5879 [Phytophthora rubi]
MSADAVDEYVPIGESTAGMCLNRFCEAVVVIFGGEHLPRSTEADIEKLVDMHEERGFVDMLRSLDCMHWSWKNRPTAWTGQYTGKESEPAIGFEAVVSRDLWF